MTPLERRQKVTLATVAKVQARPFKLGVNDCARMVAFHARQLGWKVKAAPAGSYHSIVKAQAELKKLGVANLPEAMDACGIPRIAPAFALLGDVMEIQGDHPLGTLGICMGNGRIICFHEDHPGTVILQPAAPITAWNLLP
ncbi:hypothetical protein BH10PSE12_BH10PSE12_02630 [soil metagenome]